MHIMRDGRGGGWWGGGGGWFSGRNGEDPGMNGGWREMVREVHVHVAVIEVHCTCNIVTV